MKTDLIAHVPDLAWLIDIDTVMSSRLCQVRPNSTQQIMQFLQCCDIKSIDLERVLESLELHRHDAGGANSHAGGAGGGAGPEGDARASADQDDVSSSATAGGRWYYISDSRVSEATESRALQCQAYLLFYERVL